MHHINIHHRGPLAATALILLACFGLPACGGSSSTSSTTAAASTAPAGTGTTTGPAGTTPPGAGRFATLRSCLAKEGITLPMRTPGQRRTPGAGGFPGGGAAGGPQLPKGVTREQFQAALKKCGGGQGFRRGGFSGRASQVALTAFAACMRQNGIALPAPNTSGTGPVFDTKGINTASTQFTAARKKCQSKLAGAFGRPPSGAPGASAGGA